MMSISAVDFTGRGAAFDNVAGSTRVQRIVVPEMVLPDPKASVRPFEGRTATSILVDDRWPM
jgi:hypothetical protein